MPTATRDRVAGTRSSDRAPPRRGEVEWSQPPHRTNPSFVRGRTTQRERPNRRSAGRTDWIDGDNNKVRRSGSLPDDFRLDRGRSRSGSYSSMGPAEKPIEGTHLKHNWKSKWGINHQGLLGNPSGRACWNGGDPGQGLGEGRPPDREDGSYAHPFCGYSSPAQGGTTLVEM